MMLLKYQTDTGDKQFFAVINLRGVSTNKTIICFIAMQTYKELKTVFHPANY
jgi:hypothetical protein